MDGAQYKVLGTFCEDFPYHELKSVKLSLRKETSTSPSWMWKNVQTRMSCYFQDSQLNRNMHVHAKFLPSEGTVSMRLFSYTNHYLSTASDKMQSNQIPSVKIHSC